MVQRKDLPKELPVETSHQEQPVVLAEGAGLLLDSSVLIDLERQRQSFDRILDAYGDRPTFISVVTISELRSGRRPCN